MTKVELNRESFSKLIDETIFASGSISLREAERLTGVSYVILSKHRRGSISVDNFMAILNYIHRKHGYSYNEMMERLIKREITS